jgi:hypothetical protein
MTAIFMALAAIWFLIAMGTFAWGWGWRWVARESMEKLNAAEAKVKTLQSLRDRARVIRGMH